MPASVPGPRNAWVVWVVCATAYLVAVLQRTSLGAAGIEASRRFEASASTLASFTVVQLVVYASLQIPVGLLLDRYGAKRLIASGALVMATGQALLAFTTLSSGALAARVLVGAGDAMTFISVLRIIAAWFPQRAAMMTQATALVGQLGQMISVLPLVVALHRLGWTPAMLTAAGLSLLVALLVLALAQNAPATTVTVHAPQAAGKVLSDLRSVWQHPGTRLGVWAHFITQFSGTSFALLWGFPFLVSGEGLSPTAASFLLTLFVFTGIAAAPFVSVLVQKHPLRRSWLVLGIVGLTASAWTVVLIWPGTAPLWVLTVLVVTLALGSPGSLIGFDFARTFNPPNRLGTASGIVNAGGFSASLITMLLIGIALDLTSGPGGEHSLDDFRLALTVQYLIWAVGLAGILSARRKVRIRAAAGQHRVDAAR